MMHSFYKHDAEEVRSRFYREAYGYSKDASHSPMRTAASSIGQRVASPPTSRIAFSLVSPPVGRGETHPMHTYFLLMLIIIHTI